jgi:flagellar motor switch protein FliN/FliY
MPNDPLMSQDEIERLFSQTKDLASDAPKGAPAGAATPAKPARTAAHADAGEKKLLGQNDIEKLLGEAQRMTAATPPASATVHASAAAAPPAAVHATAAPVATQQRVTSSLSEEPNIAPHDIDLLLSQAERAIESVSNPHPGDLPAGISSYRLEEFAAAPASTEAATLDLIRDVELDLKIELGRTHMYLEDVLKLRKGSVVPLDKLAGDPVDIYVNGRLIARGEVLVLNDNFCVRVAELIAGANVFA